jgi:hypothetical protein
MGIKWFEHFRERALRQEIAGGDDPLPFRLNFLQPLHVMRDAVEFEDAAQCGGKTVAVLPGMTVGVTGDLSGESQISFIVRDSVQLDQTLDDLCPANVAHGDLVAAELFYDGGIVEARPEFDEAIAESSGAREHFRSRPEAVILKQPNQQTAVAPQQRHVAIGYFASAEGITKVTIRFLQRHEFGGNPVKFRNLFPAELGHDGQRAKITPRYIAAKLSEPAHMLWHGIRQHEIVRKSWLITA